MPYSKEAKYKHIRRRHPDTIIDDTYRNVLATKYRGTTRKKYPRGTRFVIGISNTTGNWVIQSVLIPKEK